MATEINDQDVPALTLLSSDSDNDEDTRHEGEQRSWGGMTSMMTRYAEYMYVPKLMQGSDNFDEEVEPGITQKDLLQYPSSSETTSA